jgi:hypothetical protein
VVTVGVTVCGVPINPPGFHVYDTAPDALNVVESPKQIAVLVAAAITVGPENTVNVTVFVLVQPPFAPVTVYVVVTVGLTTTDVPVKAPGIHVYVVAPLPVKVAELPAQTAVGFATALTVGIGLTVKETV